MSSGTDTIGQTMALLLEVRQQLFAADTWKDHQGLSSLLLQAADGIERLRAERDDATAALQAGHDLMAIIHRDGGHYREKHGDRKASDDAIEIVCRLRAERDIQESALANLRNDLRECANSRETTLRDERNACAQLCVELSAHTSDVDHAIYAECAAAIRARGEKC